MWLYVYVLLWRIFNSPSNTYHVQHKAAASASARRSSDVAWVVEVSQRSKNVPGMVLAHLSFILVDMWAMLPVVPLFECFRNANDTFFIQTTDCSIYHNFPQTQSIRLLFSPSKRRTMPKAAKQTPKHLRKRPGPYSLPATSALVTPVDHKKSASTSNRPSASISKSKVITGLNLAQKAEELYVGADVNGLVADLIDHHLSGLEEWKAKEAASSIVLVYLLRELRYAASRLREAQRVARTCASIVSPLKNAAGTHLELNRERREDMARRMRKEGSKKTESSQCALLKACTFRLDSKSASPSSVSSFAVHLNMLSVSWL